MAQDSITENIEKAISLKINLHSNNSYRYLSKNTWNVTQELMGNSVEINSETVIGYQFKVVSNTSEGFKIKAFFEEIKTDLSLPEGSADIDLKDHQSAKFLDVLNKPFYLSLTTQGKVQKIEGLEEFTRIHEDGKVMNYEFFTKKNLSAFFESCFNILPTDPVSMGDSWSTAYSQNLNNQFKLFFDKTYTLDGLSEDMAWLSVEYTIKPSASEVLTFDVDSTDTKQEGIVEIDRESGLILFSEIKQEHKGILKDNGLEVPVKIALESSLKGELIRN